MSRHHAALMRSEPGARGRWAALRQAIIERDHSCRMCGRWDRETRWEVDHIVPVSLEGDAWDPANLQLLCRDCHFVKHGAPAQTARMLAWEEFDLQDRFDYGGGRHGV